MTEDETNPGLSVTNAAEQLVQELAGALQLDLRSLRFVECYTVPLCDVPPPRFAAVTFAVSAEGRCSAPQWKHVALSSLEEVAAAGLALPAAARNLTLRACA